MKISQFPVVGGLDLFQTQLAVAPATSSLATCVGQKFQVDGGESEVALVYTTTGITAGHLVQAPAIVADDQGLTVVSYSKPSTTSGVAGFPTLVVTIGSTAWTLNEYQNGYMFVSEGAGMGQKLKVQSNTAKASGNVTVVLEDIPSVNLDSTSRVSFTPNPYMNVIINPTSATNKPVGVTFYDIPASSYGLIGTKGSFACLNDSGTTAGLALAPSGSVAGAVKTGATTLNSVGVAEYTGVNGKASIGSFNL